MAIAIFGGGCFWGVEEIFRTTEGVEDTLVGYMGGHTEGPVTYKEICSGDTHHAEVVKVTYDEGKVSFDALLDIFFANHNPTTLNRQGPDVGTQYRSVIFPENAAQAEAAKTKIEQLTKEKAFGGREIVTTIEDAQDFWEAEDYHQKYLMKRGMSSCHI